MTTSKPGCQQFMLDENDLDGWVYAPHKFDDWGQCVFCFEWDAVPAKWITPEEAEELYPREPLENVELEGDTYKVIAHESGGKKNDKKS